MKPGRVTAAEFAKGWVEHLKDSWFEYSTEIGLSRRITPEKFKEFVIATGLQNELPIWEPIVDRYGSLDADEFINLLRYDAAPNRPVAQDSNAAPAPKGGKRRRKTRKTRKRKHVKKSRKSRRGRARK